MPKKFTFFPQPIFYPRLLHKVDRVWKIVLVIFIRNFGRIHVWLRLVSLNLSHCKVMMVFLQILAWKYREGLHNFAGIEIQAKQSWSNVYIVKIFNADHPNNASCKSHPSLQDRIVQQGHEVVLRKCSPICLQVAFLTGLAGIGEIRTLFAAEVRLGHVQHNSFWHTAFAKLILFHHTQILRPAMAQE